MSDRVAYLPSKRTKIPIRENLVDIQILNWKSYQQKIECNIKFLWALWKNSD
jgi:hypothetical protein